MCFTRLSQGMTSDLHIRLRVWGLRPRWALEGLC